MLCDMTQACGIVMRLSVSRHLPQVPRFAGLVLGTVCRFVSGVIIHRGNDNLVQCDSRSKIQLRMTEENDVTRMAGVLIIKELKFVV